MAASSIYLPFALSEEHLGKLLEEANRVKENPDTEIPLLMQAITDLALQAGKSKLEHSEIAEALETYLRYLSLEKLRRLGIVQHYEAPAPADIFLKEKEIEIRFVSPSA